MAVSQSDIKFKIEFDRANVDGPIFKFTDQTNYTDYSQVKGAIKIEYNSVVLWDNLSNIDTNPDIDGGSVGQANEALTRANTQVTPIDLPLAYNGQIVNGEYVITYEIKETAGSAVISNTVTIDYLFELPEGSISSVVDLTLTSPSITIVDNTNYTYNGITPTGIPTLKLYYPADIDLPPVSVVASELVVTSFYTGDQIGVLSAAKVWDYTSLISSSTFTTGYAVILSNDTVTDRINIPVEANGDVCTLFCCMKEFGNKLYQAKSNPTKYAQLTAIAGQVAFYFSSITAAYECGKTESVNLWVNEIKNLVDCNDDCACDGSTPTLISPINGETVGYSLTVDDGTTSVSNVTDISFSGASVTNDGDGQVTVTITGGGGGSSTFTGLSDTPSSYTGQGGKLVQVNSGESALEFSSTPVVDSIQLSGGTGTEGTFTWNNTDKTADLNLDGVTLQIGQEEVIRVVNKTAGNLLEADFRAVRVRLVSEGGAQGQRLAVVLAQANSDINSATAIGLVTEDIAVNQEGFVTISGNVNGIDTTGAKSYNGLETWADGDILYLNADHAGYLTNVKPLTPGHLVVMGYVVYAHANQGKIFVKVDNGYELEELHDVLITSVTDDEILQWNAAGPYWENRTLAEAGIQPAGTYVTSVSGTSPISSTGGTTPAISIPQATTSVSGYLTSTDWTTFNNKLSNVVQDTTPELGGNLDVLSRTVTSSVGNITLDPRPGFNVLMTLNGGGNLRYPNVDGSNGQALVTNGAGTLSFTDLATGTVTSVTGTGTSAGLTLTGTVTSSGSLTLGGTLDISADTSPRLGGNLDSDQRNITNADTITSDKYRATTNGLTIGSSTTWDVNDGSFATVRLTQDITTLTISNMAAGMPAVLRVEQTGSFGIAGWTDGTKPVKWSGGTAPTITATAGRFDIVSFISDGIYIYGSIVQDFQ